MKYGENIPVRDPYASMFSHIDTDNPPTDTSCDYPPLPHDEEPDDPPTPPEEEGTAEGHYDKDGIQFDWKASVTNTEYYEQTNTNGLVAVTYDGDPACRLSLAIKNVFLNVTNYAQLYYEGEYIPGASFVATAGGAYVNATFRCVFDADPTAEKSNQNLKIDILDDEGLTIGGFLVKISFDVLEALDAEGKEIHTLETSTPAVNPQTSWWAGVDFWN